MLFMMLIGITVLSTSGCAQEKRKSQEGEENGSQFSKEQTLEETKYGVKLVLKYDKAKQAFVGTIENKSNEIAARARVEVHLSNGVELGPTKPQDIKPMGKIKIHLPAKDQDFKRWSGHAEVGSREHEGEGRGEGHNEKGEGREKGEHNEGGERGEGHNEGAGHEEGEGHEEGGDGYSDGAESRDGNRSPITPLNESYKGVILGLEVNISYNSQKNTLEGTIKNVSSKKIRFIQNEPHILMGKKTVGELGPQRLGDLKPGEIVKTKIDISNDPKFKRRKPKFDGYFIHIEVGVTGYPTHEGGENGEKEGHEEGEGHEKGKRG